MIINLIGKAISPSQLAPDYQVIAYQQFMLNLLRFAPSELFNEATMTLLMPSIRSLGPLTMEQVHGAIPNPLPLGQSLLVVWPQLTGTDCGNRRLLRPLLPLIHAERGTVEVMDN